MNSIYIQKFWSMIKTAKENLEEFTIKENMKTIQKYLDYFFYNIYHT